MVARIQLKTEFTNFRKTTQPKWFAVGFEPGHLAQAWPHQNVKDTQHFRLWSCK